MKFQDIAVTGGGADDADPRTTPAAPVDDQILMVPPTLENSDAPPSRMLLALEGTSGHTVTVTVYALAETSVGVFQEQPDKATRRWYQHGTAVTVTVGAIAVAVPCIPGKIYLRLTSKPVANATLRVAFAV